MRAPVGAETLTAGRLVCVVQTVWVAVALEALGDAVAAAALEVAGVTSPQLWRETNQHHAPAYISAIVALHHDSDSLRSSNPGLSALPRIF